jgi:predicted phage-related endonuclease
MKNFKSKQIIEAAKELLRVIMQRQRLESKEKLLKAFLKGQMKDSDCAIAGELLITLIDREKVYLDRKKLETDLGEKLQKYIKITKYIRFDIKKMKKEKRA